MTSYDETLKTVSTYLPPVNTALILGLGIYFNNELKSLRVDATKLQEGLVLLSGGVKDAIPTLNTRSRELTDRVAYHHRHYSSQIQQLTAQISAQQVTIKALLAAVTAAGMKVDIPAAAASVTLGLDSKSRASSLSETEPHIEAEESEEEDTKPQVVAATQLAQKKSLSRSLRAAPLVAAPLSKLRSLPSVHEGEDSDDDDVASVISAATSRPRNRD